MRFSDDDKNLIKISHDSKGHDAKKIMKEFPEIKLEQNWTVRQHRVYQKQIHN